MVDTHRILFELEPLSRLDDAGRATLVRSFLERSVKARQTLYLAGDSTPGVWFVAQGFVKLTRSSAEGKELLMSLVGPGEMFGPCCDPLGASPAVCTAVTQSACRVLHMPYPTWKSLAQSTPALSQPLLGVLMGSRRGCTDLATNLAFRPVEARVAALLNTLSRWSRRAGGPVEVPALLTQSEMANAVGTAREVVTRCLARLEEQGLIERRGRRVLIPDPDALACLAG